MKKVKFLFGIHCHQPIGSFEKRFEEAYQKAYLPSIKTLENHPRIKFAAHYSGVLYDWFMEKHPEFIDLLRRLVKRGQLEILSGGYYEPILSLIPDQDKVGQIETANQFIKESFGCSPFGICLAGHMWEPSLPKIISPLGIEYAVVDEDHFALAQVPAEKLNGYYITEEEGEKLKVFPVHKKLRDLIPLRPLEELIEYLQSIAGENGTAAVYMDDGEVCGGGGGEGYLNELFSLLEENSSWIEVTTFSRYAEEFPPLGRIYLPPAGFSRNFLLQSPEANNMHKRMLEVSRRLHTLRKGKVLVGEQEKDKRLKQAITLLYRAQGGIFEGGLFEKRLRQAVYANLIQAETEMETFSRGSRSYVELVVTDIDKDGSDEVILSNNLLNLYFSPAQGGSLFELDYKPRAFNLINTLAKKRAGYQRFCLLDHFLSPGTDLKGFSLEQYNEAGDFIAAAYSFVPRRKETEASLQLSREGKVGDMPVKVEKNISLLARQSIVNVEYKITNRGEAEDEFCFGVEFNFSLSQDNDLESGEEAKKARTVKLVDGESGFEVLLELDKPARLWRFSSCQSTAVFPSWRFVLEPGQSWDLKITLRIEE